MGVVVAQVSSLCRGMQQQAPRALNVQRVPLIMSDQLGNRAKIGGIWREAANVPALASLV